MSPRPASFSVCCGSLPKEPRGRVVEQVEREFVQRLRGVHRPGSLWGQVTSSITGNIGNTGNIDSYRGPAVFYRLSKLGPGGQIQVLRGDGKTATFTVDAKRQYPKSSFPANDVYGAVDYAGLRLVTCGGEFDRTARSYLDNIVVYAHLTGTT
jgi:hypothetical protein